LLPITLGCMLINGGRGTLVTPTFAEVAGGTLAEVAGGTLAEVAGGALVTVPPAASCHNVVAGTGTGAAPRRQLGHVLD
jgi:hypothetical protein